MERQGHLGVVRHSWNNQQAHYRCRFPSEYAIANKVDHPVTVYLREDAILGPLDTWLAKAFDPARMERSLSRMKNAQPDTDARADAIRRTLEDCDRKLTRHRAALEAGADPALVAAWSREVQAQRTAAQAQLAGITNGQTPGRRMTKDEIRSLVDALGGLLRILHEADPAGQAGGLPAARPAADLRSQESDHPGRDAAAARYVRSVCVRGRTGPMRTCPDESGAIGGGPNAALDAPPDT
jgi:hypothetical protein